MNKENHKSSVEEEVITIKIDKFLMPISILLSALILSSGLLLGLNNVSSAIRATPITAGTGTTGTTTNPTETTAGTASKVTQEQLKSLFNSNNITFGSADSKVLFVEFSDPSCPYCHVAAGKNGALNKKVGAQFTLVADGGTYVAPVVEMRKLVESGQAAYTWIYTNGHGNGEMGTKALYCAKELGKYWEAHDLLYSEAGYAIINDNVKNDTSKSGVLADFLSSAVDSGAMKSCLDGGKYNSRIVDDQTTAATFGAQGTPNFFVNTTNYAGAYNFNDMKKTVDAALGQ